jgi:hypothetical protein
VNLKGRFLSFVVFCAASHIVYAQTPEKLLVGKWVFESMTVNDDGTERTPKKAPGVSTLEYAENGTWRLVSPNMTSGTYRWVDPTHIESKILDSNFQVQVGWTSIKEVKVTPRRLVLVSTITKEALDKFAPTLSGPTQPKVSITTSVFVRAP